MPSSDFTFLKFLGKGSYGSVYTAKRKSDGKVYAIKQIDTTRMKNTEKEEAFNEVRVIASVYHPNIIGYYEAFYEDNKLFIVMECAPNGDLRNEMELKKAKKQSYDETTIWNYLLQMLAGLNALHKRNILHRDMKLANIFIGDDGILKIGDLGVAKIMKNRVDFAMTSIGTPYYIAPEIWLNRPYGPKCDMWSLGCMIYELCTFNPPFTARDIKGLQNAIIRNKQRMISPKYSRDLQNVIDMLLEKDPRKRPSVAHLMQTQEITKRISMAKTPLDIEVMSPPKLAQTIKLQHPSAPRPMRFIGNSRGGRSLSSGSKWQGKESSNSCNRYGVALSNRGSHSNSREQRRSASSEIKFPSPVYEKRAKWDAAARLVMAGDRFPASPSLNNIPQRSHSNRVYPSSADGLPYNNSSSNCNVYNSDNMRTPSVDAFKNPLPPIPNRIDRFSTSPDIEKDTPTPPAEGRPVIAGVYYIENQAPHWRGAVPHNMIPQRVPYQANPQLDRAPHNLIPQPPPGVPYHGSRPCSNNRAYVRPTRSADEAPSHNACDYAPNPRFDPENCGNGGNNNNMKGIRMRRIPTGKL